MTTRPIVARPAAVLALAIAATLAFSLLIAWRTEGERRVYLLVYFAPIGVPFVAYLLERAGRRRDIRPSQWAIEIPVIALALARAVYLVPLVSGHALFLTYAIATCRTAVARWTAAIVMAEVVYLKAFVWHDPTWVGGVVLGAVASSGFHAVRRRGDERRDRPGGAFGPGDRGLAGDRRGDRADVA